MTDTSIPDIYAAFDIPAEGSAENSDETHDPIDDANPAPHVPAAPADLETVTEPDAYADALAELTPEQQAAYDKLIAAALAGHAPEDEGLAALETADSRTGMEPTHSLNGIPLVQKTDTLGRTYYLDTRTKVRVKTTGYESQILPVDADGKLADAPLAIPTQVLLELFSLACACLVNVGGRMDRGWYSARKRGEREVELTVPHGNGDGRFLITLPESIPVDARAYEAEE